MIYKKMVILFFMALIIDVCVSCAKKREIDGIYVHLSGEQHYYTLTVSKVADNKHSVTFEGVPLDRMKTAPWSLACEQELKGDTITCDSVTLEFNADQETVTATFDNKDKQVFVSDKKSINEETRVYEKNK